MLKEFREFAMRGNVVDLAIGVIIGGAFGLIVNSLVADIFMPIIGVVTGGVNFAELGYELKAATVNAAGETVPAVVIGYGKFIQFTINFLIVAFAMFMVVKAMNRMKKKEAEAPPAPPVPTAEEKLLVEIRDLLAKGR